jgi:hypothetical protein
MNLRHPSWELKFALSLVVAFGALNLLHYACYRDAASILLANLTALAFLPVSVLVVTLFVERMLAAREKSQRLAKTSMLLGVFYSAVGARLLEHCVAWDPAPRPLQDAFGSAAAWERFSPQLAEQVLAGHPFALSPGPARLRELRELLSAQQDLLLRLLENPILLEHETFTDLLRAVFHLAEELNFRKEFEALPAADLAHLAGDVQRVYGQLTREWVSYLGTLQRDYPYLFSLAVRTNPLSTHPSAVIGAISAAGVAEE